MNIQSILLKNCNTKEAKLSQGAKEIKENSDIKIFERNNIEFVVGSYGKTLYAVDKAIDWSLSSNVLYISGNNEGDVLENVCSMIDKILSKDSIERKDKVNKSTNDFSIIDNKKEVSLERIMEVYHSELEYEPELGLVVVDGLNINKYTPIQLNEFAEKVENTGVKWMITFSVI